MIFAKSFGEVSPGRFVGKLFNGSLYARTNFIGSDASHRDTPQALLVEQSANSTIPTHFHGINQYQVVVQGDGFLGKHAIKPVVVHYANAYTAYGPIKAKEEGVFYFTLRAQSEPGAFFIPEARPFQKPNKRRNLTVDVEVLNDTDDLLNLSEVMEIDLFEREDAGLAALYIRLGPGMSYSGLDPSSGGGQYYLVLSGSLIHEGKEYGKWSCIFIEPPEQSFRLTAGHTGIELLILQFPFWETGTELDPDSPLYAEKVV